jgi:uncharacterized membrane protein
MSRVLTLCAHRWRLLLGAAGGLAAGLAASRADILPGAAPLIGWVSGAALYLSTTVWMFFTTDEATVRRHAALEDENRGILTGLVLAAAVASLGVTALALKGAKVFGAEHLESAQTWILVLAVSTLVLSWLLTQCLFVLHYAHRYFGDRDADGAVDGGIEFPGEPPRTYRDFIYVAVCIGATSQVSDFNITTSRFRLLVTLHALFAFAFNTMVLALGINILAGLVGH